MSEILYQTPDVVLWQAALVSILVSYLFAQSIALGYMLTHQEVSYSRSFVVSLVAAGLVSTVLMLAIGNNLARGIGIVGTLALIRFRMQMHDSLDMIHVFAAFAGGVAAGRSRRPPSGHDRLRTGSRPPACPRITTGLPKPLAPQGGDFFTSGSRSS